MLIMSFNHRKRVFFMSFLDDLTLDQRQLLVALPYRVGLMVSQCDTSGGDESDEQEALALKNIIVGFSGEVFGAETVQYVISETVRRQDEWSAWEENLDAVTGECAKAIDILQAFVDPKEVNAFKQHLMEVGEAVATAFREVDELSFVENFKLKMLYKKLGREAQKAQMQYKTFDEFLNISAAERAALNRLSAALDIRYVV
jgi:hypothetical protein